MDTPLNEQRIRGLLRRYFYLDFLHQRYKWFGGPRLPRIVRLKKKIRTELEEWAHGTRVTEVG